jgi:16S rRNA processing protein RimM
MAVVGYVARPHGIRGQVVVNLETDFPQERFREGGELFTRRAGAVERLTLTAVRFQGGRPIVGWAGVNDVNEALPYVGGELRVPRDWLPRLPPGVYYRHDLVGCRVTTPSGEPVGVVREVEGALVGSCLIVEMPHGEAMVPLVAEICTLVDVSGQVIVIEPPSGLLELNAHRERRPHGQRRQSR